MLNFGDNNFFAYEMIGDFRSSGEWIHPFRIIDSFELILVKEGTVYLEENNIKYELHSGDMILLEPNLPHGGYKASQEKTSFYWFHFQTNIPLPFKIATCQDLFDIHHYIKKLLNATNGGYCSEATADALGFIIFDELSKTQGQSSSPVQSIIEYIRINRNRDISVMQIAEEFGYNPDYLGRFFKKNLKIGLKEYISLQRLAFSKELLLTTALSIKEIAKKSGYENENLFIKFFIYHEKITPTAFRNRYTHTHLNNK